MANKGEPTPPRRGVWHGLWASLLIGLGIPALAVLAVAGAWLFRQDIAAWALERGATAAGLGRAQVTVTHLGLERVEINDIRIGETVAAEHLVISYRPVGLLRGEVDQIRLTGVAVSPAPDGGGRFDIGDYLSGDLVPIPAIPFRRLILEDSRLILPELSVSADADITATTPDQLEFTASASLNGATATGTLSASGKIRSESGALSTDLRLHPRGQINGITGEADLSLKADLADGGLRGHIVVAEIQGERATATPVALGGATGTIDFAANGAGQAQIAGDVTLSDVTAAGWSFPSVPVRLSLVEDSVSLVLQLNAPESGLMLTGEVAGTLPQLVEELSFAATGSLLPHNLRLPIDAEARGSIRIDLKGKVREPMTLAAASPDAWVGALTAAGEVGLDLTEIRYADKIQLDRLRGRFDWSVRNSTLLIDSAKGLETEIRPPAQLVSRFGEVVPDRIGVQFGGPAATAPNVRIAPTADGWTLALATGLRVPQVGASAEGDVRLASDRSFRLRQISAPFLLAEVPDLSPFGVTGSAEFTVTDLAATPSEGTAELSGGITLTTLQRNNFEATGVNAELDTGVAWQNGNLSLQFGPSTRVSFDALGGDGFSVGPTTIGLTQGPTPLVISQDGSITYDLRVAPLAGTLSTSAAEAEITLPVLRVSGSETAARLTFDDASARGHAADVAANDVAGTVDINQGGQAEWDVAIGRLHLRADDPTATAVSVTLTGARDPAGELRFDARAIDASAGLDLHMAGTHNPGQAQGEADLRLAPLQFAENGLQPNQIIPRFPENVTKVSGNVSAEGTIDWRDGAVVSDLRVNFDALDLTAGAQIIHDLTGDLRITGLRPPATAPDQNLALSLSQGQLGRFPIDVTFQLRPDGRLEIDEVTVEAMGGRVQATETTVMTADPLPIETRLFVEDVDLAQVLALAKVEGLTGTGRLSGQVPLRVEDGKVAIDDGELAAAGSGVVQFDKAKLPAALLARGDIVSLALETLTDFNYDTMDMQIDKSLEGNGVVKVQLEGANPAVLDGHPFRFNIALEADFDRLAELITQGLATTDAVLLSAGEGAAR